MGKVRDICNGIRLEIPKDVPNFYKELMKCCWDNDPKKRPTASQINEKLEEWVTLIYDDPNPSAISFECSIAEQKRWRMSKKPGHQFIHPDAYYTSRILFSR